MKKVFTPLLVSFLVAGAIIPANATPNDKAHSYGGIQQATMSLDELADEGVIEEASNASPLVASDGKTSELQSGSVGLKTESGGATYIDDKVVTIAEDHNILYEKLSYGDSRAVIQIESPNSPINYSFEMTGEYEALVLREDGGIDAVDDKRNVVASIDAPWAFDADGDAVPTHFEIHGRTITQVIEHNDSYDYGIVADPTLREHIKKIIAGCLGVQPHTLTVWGVLESTFSSWKKAIKFLIRRIGFLAALSCLGGIVYQYL